VIDGATNTVRSSIAVGADPRALAVNLTTNTVFVANLADNTVTKIDGASGAATTFAAGSVPLAVAVNPATNEVYVANIGAAGAEGDLTVIDGSTDATTTAAVGINPGNGGGGPEIIAVNTVTNRIYVNNANGGALGGNVAVIEGAGNTVTDVAYGSNPVAVAVDPAANKVYAVSGTSAVVTVIDGATNLYSTISVGAVPIAVAVNPATNKAYVVGSTSPGTLTVIDGATHATTTVAVGSLPNAVAVNPTNDTIYVTNLGDGTLTVVNGATNVTSTLAIGANPTAVAVNPVTNRVYVANGTSGTVTVVSPAATGPAVTAQPLSQTVAAGSTVVFSVATSAAGPVTYQWYRGGMPLSDGGGMVGSATATLFLGGGATTASAGTYTCAVTAGGTTATSAGAVLTVATTGNPGVMANVSTRGFVGTGGNILIAGFVITGSTSRTVLIRGAGPALTPLGVSGVLGDPRLQLFGTGQNLVAANFGWGGSPQVVAAAAAVGAFPWTQPLGDDSAILVTLAPGTYTAQIAGNTGDTGVALIEVYALP
jgi:YVTN family beta-propeller protein